MGHDFSLSVFTIEINGTPTVALQAKRYHEAEQFCEQDRLRADLSTSTSHGVPLCDTNAHMKVRLATLTEADRYRKAKKTNPQCDEFTVVYLLDLDP
jgi:hypothetical protein